MRTLGFHIPHANHLRGIAPVSDHLARMAGGTFRVVIFCPTWPIGKRWLQVNPQELITLFSSMSCTNASGICSFRSTA